MNQITSFDMDVVFGNARFVVPCNNAGIYNPQIDQNERIDDNSDVNPFHEHQYYEMHIFTFDHVNDVILQMPDTELVIPLGNAVILSPGTFHFSVKSDNQIVFTFQFEALDHPETGYHQYIFNLLKMVSDKSISLIPITDEWIRCLRSYEALDFDGTVSVYCRKKALLYEVISGLVTILEQRNTDAAPIPIFPSIDKKSIGVILNAYIDEYALDIKQIAKRIGYSESHTRRLYRECFGSGLETLRRQRRLITAKKYLTTTNMLIRDIARRSGFSDADTMCAVFLKEEGCTPTQYRKKNIDSQS